jgi:hypothetical protein
MCPPIEEASLPEFWLELSYCGDSLCPPEGITTTPLYSEQVRDLPGRREFPLRCELFGAAGTYALSLKPSEPSATPVLTPTPAYLKVIMDINFMALDAKKETKPTSVPNRPEPYITIPEERRKFIKSSD